MKKSIECNIKRDASNLVGRIPNLTPSRIIPLSQLAEKAADGIWRVRVDDIALLVRMGRWGGFLRRYFTHSYLKRMGGASNAPP